MRQLKDYLHLYLGAWVTISDCRATIEFTDGKWALSADLLHHILLENCKCDSIELRPLSGMTDEEMQEESIRGNFSEGDTDTYGRQGAARGIKFLLSKHFDLFGLIRYGLATEKK